jgi:hypothetical protein
MDKSASRQFVYGAQQRVALADIESGVAFDIFTKLPNGVIPIALSVITLTPFDSGTSDLLDIGYAARGNAAAPIVADPDAYKADLSIASVAGTKADLTVLPGVIDDASGGLQLTGTWTGAGTAATEGEILIVGVFMEEHREQFTQG